MAENENDQKILLEWTKEAKMNKVYTHLSPSFISVEESDKTLKKITDIKVDTFDIRVYSGKTADLIQIISMSEGSFMTWKRVKKLELVINKWIESGYTRGIISIYY